MLTLQIRWTFQMTNCKNCGDDMIFHTRDYNTVCNVRFCGCTTGESK